MIDLCLEDECVFVYKMMKITLLPSVTVTVSNQM